MQQHMTTITNRPSSTEFTYEELIQDWQNYDPNVYSDDPHNVEQPNGGGGGGYVKIINRTRNDDTSHTDYDYQTHEQMITDNIIYDDGGGGGDGGDGEMVEGEIVDDDDIITEEYITTDDYSMDNVIEMDTDTDGGGTIYTTNDNVVTFISNNIIGS